MHAEIVFREELCKCVESEPPANHCREIFSYPSVWLRGSLAITHAALSWGAKPGNRDAAANHNEKEQGDF